MQNFFRYALLFGALLAGAGPTSAQITVSEEVVPAFENALAKAVDADGKALQVSGIAFESQPAGGEDPGTQLINGVIVDATFFPAMLRASHGGRCTATLIGPSAAMLAAHCFSSDIAIVKFKMAGRPEFRGVCESAPGFGARRSEDWALCVLEREIGNIFYEGVDLGSLPPVGTRIMLTGYGCTAQDQATPLAGRPLKAGFSRRMAGTGSAQDASYFFTKSDPDAGEAVLCQGDSGGPAFVLFGNTMDSSRKIVGVNSGTNIPTGTGFISATASAAGADFIRKWSQRNDQVICGHNAGTGTRCRWNG